MKELQYRRAQNLLGHAQVACELLIGIKKDSPDLPGIEDAINATLVTKNYIFIKVLELERSPELWVAR